MNHLKEIPNRPREIVYADDSTRRRSNTLGVNPSIFPIHVLTEELVLVDWGPMTLTVSAWRKGRARPVIAARAAHAALRRLRILADFQGYLARPVS
ncbi:MAG: hypothetical protein GY859_05240, partial [Desulfobacterales bacterium]|nr:hypothetical protein [Desulfobacterales bacterium]